MVSKVHGAAQRRVGRREDAPPPQRLLSPARSPHCWPPLLSTDLLHLFAAVSSLSPWSAFFNMHAPSLWPRLAEKLLRDQGWVSSREAWLGNGIAQ